MRIAQAGHMGLFMFDVQCGRLGGGESEPAFLALLWQKNGLSGLPVDNWTTCSPLQTVS